MAPHLSSNELHWLHGLHCAGETMVEAHASLTDRRAQSGLPAPDLTTVRRALKHFAQRNAAVESRGRKRKMTDRAVHGMENIRKKMTKEADGDYEIHWNDLVRKSRARVHRTTAKRSMNRAGLNVAWRRAREKPLRKPEHEQAQTLETYTSTINRAVATHTSTIGRAVVDRIVSMIASTRILYV